MIISINKDDICNLSRIPVAMKNNPCYLTAAQSILLDDDFKCEETHLYRHYTTYKPQTLYDMYGVVEKLRNYSFDSAFLPWIHVSPVTEQRDIAFIKRDKSFIKDQCKMIRSLVLSIKKNGYSPSVFSNKDIKHRDWPHPIDWRRGGQITGYFLCGENNKKFYVASGNHRAAVLSSILPNKGIPVIYEKKEFLKPRDFIKRGDISPEYHLSLAHQWPSVKSGFLTEAEATRIAEVYLNE